MARRSLAEVAELSGPGELSCNWAMLHGGSRRKPATKGRPERKSLTADYPRKFEQIASFDQRCRKIQNEAGLASSPVDVIAKTVEDLLIKRYKDRQVEGVAKEQQHRETAYSPVVKSHKRRRKKVQNMYQSSSCYCNSAASLIPHLTSTYAEVPRDKVTIAAILGEAHDQNNWEEQLGKCGLINEIKTRQVQMCAKALADKMFIDKQVFYQEGFSSECKPFSNALEVLSSSKHFSVNLQEPKYQLADAADEIVIMKPVVARSGGCSENVTCSCSSIQSHCEFCEKLPSGKAKPASFSFREMKRKLKHKFRGNRKEASEFLAGCTEVKLSHSGPALRTEDGCITKTFSVSSVNEKKEGKLRDRGGFISDTNKVREKLDFPSMRFSEKHEFDVILEAKRHLSERLKNLTEIPSPTSKRSTENLGGILSLPEHEWRPLSPRSNSKSCSGSPQMRYSPCSSTSSSAFYRVPCGRETTALFSPRSIKEIPLSETMGTNTVSSLFQSIDETGDIIISPTDEIKASNGKSDLSELTNIKQAQSYIKDVPNEIKYFDETSTMLRTDTVHGSTMHHALPLQDSISTSETITSSSDDCTSPRPSISQLDAADSTKDQEEHQSPVSVLDAFFMEDEYSPQSIMLQTERKLQPRRLDFDDCSLQSILQDQPVEEYECIEEQDYIALYVHLVLKASCLSWDELFQFESKPDQELLHESVLDELKFLPDDKLLFDHMNEVLLQIYESHCCCPWPGSTKQEIRSGSLEYAVLDEIMQVADFYLLPRTEKRMLDQLVSKDIARSRSWLNVGKEKEEITIDISEEVVEDLILDMILDSLT